MSKTNPDPVSFLHLMPAQKANFDNLYASLWQQSHVPPEVLELCRLRLLQLHRAQPELAGPSREKVEVNRGKRQALSRWNSNALFGAGERACLAFTEVYAADAQAISDEAADAVKAHYGDEGLVALIEALGILDGWVRIGLLWPQAHGAGD